VFAKLDKKGKNKKAVIIAITRKLFVLIYTLWNNDSVFIQDFQCSNRMANKASAPDNNSNLLAKI
jgi:hypothetical protein